MNDNTIDPPHQHQQLSPHETEEYKLIKALRDALLRTQWMSHHNVDNIMVIRRADNYLLNPPTK